MRRDAGGRLYYVCECGGPFYANEYILERARMWGDQAAPNDAPEWIRKGLRFKPGTRRTEDRPRAPAPTSELPAAEPSAGAGAGGTPQPAPGRAGERPQEPAPALGSARWGFGLFK